MLELNIFKNNNRTSVSYGKYYAHVEYKKTTIVRGTESPGVTWFLG